MKKRNILFLLFIFALAFTGIMHLKAFQDSYTGLLSAENEGVPFYYQYGGTPSGNAANYVYTVAVWEQNIADGNLWNDPQGNSHGVGQYPTTTAQKNAELAALHACSTNSSTFCVRVSSAAKYKIGSQEVFCLDGLTGFDVGKTLTYTKSGSTQENKGMACALVELYDKLKFDSSGNVKMDEISKADIYAIQKRMWTHQYDNKDCTSTADRTITKSISSSVSISNGGNSSLTLNPALGYYVSGPITVSATNVNPSNLDITLTLSGAPTGTIISSSSTQKTAIANNKVRSGAVVYVMVPASSVTSTHNIDISASASVKQSEVITITSKFQIYTATGSQTMGIPELARSFNYTYGNQSSTKLTLSVNKTHGSIKIIKKETGGTSLLAGVKFRLVKTAGLTAAVDINGNTVSDVVTDANGVATFNNIPYGDYTIIELETAKGYTISATNTPFTLNTAEKTITIENKPMKLQIEKKDSSSKSNITGSMLVLLDSNFTAVNTGWSTTSQSAVFKIKQGTYYLYESSAPTGYQKLKKALKFKINDNGKITETEEGSLNVSSKTFSGGSSNLESFEIDNSTIKITIFNNKLTYISKRDITNSEELPGASIRIYQYISSTKKTGNLVDSWTSTTTPHSNYYPAGQYVLVETVAPNEYKKLTNAFVFSVSASGVPQLISVGTLDSKYEVFTQTSQSSENIKAEGNTLIVLNELVKVRISKKSITGTDELVGAKIKITSDKTDFVPITFTSTNKPKQLQLPRLASGQYYYMEETAAPVGYEPLLTVFKFYILDDGTPKLVSIGKWNSKNKFEEDKKLTDAYVRFPDSKSKEKDLITLLNEPIKTIVYKMDSKGKKILSGAVLIVKNLTTGKETKIVTTNKEYTYLFGPGKYSLIETEAPEGYQKNEIEYQFEILASGDIKLLSGKNDNIKIENNKIIIYNTIIDTPDTGKSSLILPVLGCILLLFGTSIVYFVIRKKQISSF